MANADGGMFFEFDNRDEAYKFCHSGSNLTTFQLGKVYRLEDDWWIVPYDLVFPIRESEISWPKAFESFSSARLGYSKPDIEKGKRGVSVRIDRNIGLVFHDCPMSNRDILPFFVRAMSYKYRHVFLVLEPSNLEFRFMITHETFLFKSYMCSFNSDGSHSNYGPVKGNLSRAYFLKKAIKIAEKLLKQH